MKRESRAPPIIAIVLLLLPVLYVGSYLAMVHHSVQTVTLSIASSDASSASFPPRDIPIYKHYRFDADSWASRFFWPLEQIDRKLRPQEWSAPSVSF